MTFSRILIALLVYVFAFAAYTWPLASDPGRLFISEAGTRSDAPCILNNVWLLEKNLEEGNNTLDDPYLFYPQGTSILLHGHTLGLDAFALLFSNKVFAVNLFVFLCFVGSALGVYALCFSITCSANSALLCGFIVAFSPFKLLQLQDHIWYALTLTIPVFIYFFSRGFYKNDHFNIRHFSWRSFLICALIGLFTVSLDYYITLFLIIYALFFTLLVLTRIPEKLQLKNWKHVLALSLIVIALFLIVDYLRHHGYDDKGAYYWAGDLAGYFYPLFREFQTAFNDSLGVHTRTYAENGFFLGYAFIFLSLYVLLRKRNFDKTLTYRYLLFLVLIFFLLTHPEIIIMGKSICKNPLSVLHYLPFFNNLRLASRYFLLSSLFFSLFIFHIAYLKEIHIKNSICFILLVVLMAEYSIARPHTFLDTGAVPAVYQEVRKSEKQVLLSLPFGLRDGFTETGRVNTLDLFYQTIHEKKIFGGYISRLDTSLVNTYKQEPVLAFLMDLSQHGDSSSFSSPDSLQNFAFLRKFNPGIILINPEMQLQKVRAWLDSIKQITEYDYREMGGYSLIEIHRLKTP